MKLFLFFCWICNKVEWDQNEHNKSKIHCSKCNQDEQKKYCIRCNAYVKRKCDYYYTFIEEHDFNQKLRDFHGNFIEVKS